jgi:hypothetical protein
MPDDMLVWLRLDSLRCVRAGAWRRGPLLCLLVASSVALALPAGTSTVCDPAQCLRERQQSDPGAAGGTDADSDCSGPFHVCHCCAHVQLLPQRAAFGIAPAYASGRPLLAAPVDVDLAAHPAPLLRPPSSGSLARS